MSDHLAAAFPRLASNLPKIVLADLPTPVAELPLATTFGNRQVSIKYDNQTGRLYGGNKVSLIAVLGSSEIESSVKVAEY